MVDGWTSAPPEQDRVFTVGGRTLKKKIENQTLIKQGS